MAATIIRMLELKMKLDSGPLLFLAAFSLMTFFAFSSELHSQSNASGNQGIIRGSDNNQNVGQGNTIISGNEIGTIIMGDATALDQEDRALMERLSTLLQNLSDSGQLSITRSGAATIARETSNFLKNPEFTHNVIESTQFTLPRREVFFVGQTGVGISWHSGCTKPGHISITVSGQTIECFQVGQAVTVQHETPFYVQYVGRDPDRPTSRRTFAVVPIE